MGLVINKWMSERLLSLKNLISHLKIFYFLSEIFAFKSLSSKEKIISIRDKIWFLELKVVIATWLFWDLYSKKQKRGHSTPLLQIPVVVVVVVIYCPHPRTCLLTSKRGEGRDRERQRNIDVREKHPSVVPLTLPNQGLNPQAKHVPWPRIEPMTFPIMRWHSNQLSHTARTRCQLLRGERALYIELKEYSGSPLVFQSEW